MAFDDGLNEYKERRLKRLTKLYNTIIAFYM